MSNITEKFVQAGEYRTHYWEVGEGDNLLMLHSADPGSGGWLEFRENLEALGRQFRVLAPDIIGFGKTDSRGRGQQLRAEGIASDDADKRRADAQQRQVVRDVPRH